MMPLMHHDHGTHYDAMTKAFEAAEAIMERIDAPVVPQKRTYGRTVNLRGIVHLLGCVNRVETLCGKEMAYGLITTPARTAGTVVTCTTCAQGISV